MGMMRFTSLRAADAFIRERGDNLPAVPCGDGLKFAALVLNSLVLNCADAQVQGNALGLGDHVGPHCFACLI